MSKQTIDFAAVEPSQLPIHERLRNWSRWVVPRIGSGVSPMLRGYRGHAWQWHTPEFRETCDVLDAVVIEKIVAKLPERHRTALRWSYVYRCTPAIAARELALSCDGLYRHVRDARQMVMNMLRK